MHILASSSFLQLKAAPTAAHHSDHDRCLLFLSELHHGINQFLPLLISENSE
jgi:hypothetical protein